LAIIVFRIIENNENFADKYGNGIYLHLSIMVYKRRLFYFPGLISLIGLFVFFCGNKDRLAEKKIYVLVLNVPAIDQHSPWDMNEFTDVALYNLLKKKERIKVIFDSDPVTNQNKISFIRAKARELKYTRDTTKVILSEFTDQTSYGDIVRLIDQCYEDNIQWFSLWKNSLIIFGEYPPPKKDTSSLIIPMHVCTTGAMQHEQYMVRKKKEERLQRLKRYTYRESLYLYAGWLTMLVSFLYFRKSSF
jgi:hypothetical protein